MTRRLFALFVVLLLCCACRPQRTPPPRPRNSEPTTIPNTNLSNPSDPNTAKSDHAFHINFNMDENVVCPEGGKCDAAYVPTMSVYFRGNINITNNGDVNGDGQIVITDAEPCQTLLPDISSCQITGVSNGSFSISGNAAGNQLNITLESSELPVINVIMTTQSPSGDVVIDLTTTYQEEMRKLFENAGLFDKEFQTNAAISTTSAANYFEGSSTFGSARTLHGMGGLFFINSDTPLPQSFQP